MSSKGTSDERRRDALLLRLLRTLPQSRAELAAQVRREKDKGSRIGGEEADRKRRSKKS